MAAALPWQLVQVPGLGPDVCGLPPVPVNDAKPPTLVLVWQVTQSAVVVM